MRQVHTAHIKLELSFDSVAPASAWIDRFEDENGRFYEQGHDKWLGEWRSGSDGTQPWYLTLHQGRLWRVKDGSFRKPPPGIRQIGILRDFTSMYHSTEVIGAAQVGNSKAAVVRGISEDGSSTLYYFDSETGLLVRLDIPIRLKEYGYDGTELHPGSKDTWGFVSTCFYKRYEPEPHSHVLFSREAECTAEGMRQIIRTTKIEVNNPIDPKMLVKP